MTKIVGHRGAAGSELENTIKSFKLAAELGVDAIELDVLATKDGKIVVCHDDDLHRLTGRHTLISQITYAELAEIHLKNDETIPLLYDVLAITGNIPIVLDIKAGAHLAEFFTILDKFPNTNFTIVTPHGHIIPECKQRRPDIPAFLNKSLFPFRLMNLMRKYQADGLNVRHIWMNPFLYRTAKREGLQIQVWTVNSTLVGAMLKKLYPGIWICTNHPDKFLQALSDNRIPAKKT